MTSTDGFVVSPRADGVVEMVVLGAWSAEARGAFEAGGVERLVLNYALGFQEPDLEFLRGLSVRELVVLDRRLQSLEPIYSLAPTLEALQLVAKQPLLVLDLGRFPALTGLSADWGQVKASFAEASGLEDVFLGSYSERDLEPLTSAPRLTRLVMKDRPGVQSLNGLAGLPALTELGIHLARQLTDVSDLQAATQLTELHLEGCRKVPTMDPLATLRALELLNVSDSGDFPDVEGLGGLVGLRDLMLYGTTKVLSGDLSPIAGLPELRQLRMQNRRYYAPSVPDIEQAVALRRGSR